MAQHQEIERKFLLKRLPKDWKHYRSMRFVQGYFLVAGYWRIWRSAKSEPSSSWRRRPCNLRFGQC